MRAQRLITGLLTGLATCALATDSTIHPSNRWAWCASTGWINCRTDLTNGAVIGEFVCAGYLYSSSVGWIHLGNGNPTNGCQYSNAATNDYGINHLGQGKLRGTAWAGSTGWIYFEDTGGPGVDLYSGIVTGYAWSATLGWIGFSNLTQQVKTLELAAGANADADQLPDAWERTWTNGTGVLNGTNDFDRDGMTDYEEYVADTNPLNSNDLFQITDLSFTNSTNFLVTWTSEQSRQYRIETNSALTNGAWGDSGLGLETADPSNTSSRTFSGGSNTHLFYRVKAVVPLSE